MNKTLANRKAAVRIPVSLREAGMFLHRWLGLTAGLVFVIAGLTGSLLAYQQELKTWMYPEIAGPPPEGWQERRAGVLSRIHAEGGSDVVLVRFPKSLQGVYETYLADDRLQYRDALDGDVVLERSPGNDWLEFSRELHVHLLAGETGELVMGWLGVIMLALLLTGIWTWWPRRGLWRFAFRYPKTDRALPKVFWWHKTVGIALVPLLFFVTLTGVAMVFYFTAQGVLTSMLGGKPVDVPEKVERSGMSHDWKSIIASLDETLEEGRTVFLYPSRAADEALRFRKQMPGELHPNGRSFIAMDRQGGVLHANDATELEAGMRATHAIYPLHSGQVGSETWRLVVALCGLLPLGFFITGFIIWRGKPKK